eukprot:NODE_369_length_9975_cov_0.256582.p7 type:complete len:203 gc:universal NODE_369_length_9975_cov_0.256582:5812-6420(+)
MNFVGFGDGISKNIFFRSKLLIAILIMSVTRGLMNISAVELDATTLSFGDEFNGACPLMLGEVYQLLHTQKLERVSMLQSGHSTTPGYSTPGSNITGPTNAMTLNSYNDMSDEDLTRTLPKTFLSAYEHVKQFSKINEINALNDVKEQGKIYNLHRFEICQLGNLIVEGSDEAKSLIPSIKVEDSILRRLLDEIKTMKNFIQ